MFLARSGRRGEAEPGRKSLLSLAVAAYSTRMTAAREICLKDGRTVLMREAGPRDTPAIARLLAGLSPASFRSRFQCERGGPAMLDVLARTDRVAGTQCLVITAAGGLIAEARHVPIGDGAAEIALTVADQYQHAGLGQILLDELAASAAAAGLERLRAVVGLDNVAMLRLLRRRQWILADTTDEYAMAVLEFSAAGGIPGWPTAGAGRRILVERRGWYDDRRTAALRAAGHTIRQCAGPGQRAGRRCPLTAAGQCQLAAGADQIICLLPGDDPDCRAVAEAHRSRWPYKVAD